MTPPGASTARCPDAETLAAYLDDRLSAAERASLVSHLADCDECRELVVEASAAMAEAPAAPVRRTGIGTLRLYPAGGLLAAAAVVALALFVPDGWLDRRRAGANLEALVAAVGTTRPVEGRLTGGFRHGPLAAQMRAGDSGPAVSPEVVIAVARAEQGVSLRRGWRSLWVFGVAQLVAGNVDGAIRALAEARELRPDAAGVAVDLSAAYLERTRFVPAADVPAVLAQGIESASRATRLSPRAPEAWFNLATLQQKAGSPEAEASWRRYLELERDEAWALEGRRQLARLSGSAK